MSDPRLDALERLTALRDAGTLSEEEYEAEKARVLRGEGMGRPWGRYAALAAGVIALVAGGGWAVRQAVGPVVDQTKAEPAASAEASDAAVAITPSPSPSADPYAGAEMTGCRQGQCQWEKVLGTVDVEKTDIGTLRRQEAWSGTSYDGDGMGQAPAKPEITWEKSPVQTWVFCSTRQPAIAFSNHWDGGDGSWTGHWIDLFDVGGYMTDSARIYMRVCHDVDFFRPDIARVLGRMGYRPGTPSEQRALSRPQEITDLPVAEEPEG